MKEKEKEPLSKTSRFCRFNLLSMGHYITCRYCGTRSKGQLECRCAEERTINLIQMKAGAQILETLYDDFDHPFVYLIEKLHFKDGAIIFMVTYIGSASGEYNPNEKITVIDEEEYNEIKEKCVQRDAKKQSEEVQEDSDEEVDEKVDEEEEVPAEKEEMSAGMRAWKTENYYTFTMLDRVGKTRRGFFGLLRSGQRCTVAHCFPESLMEKEKEKLTKSGWVFVGDGIWEKNNKAHKKNVQAQKKDSDIRRSPPPGVVDKSTNTVCGYKVGPSPCSAHKPVTSEQIDRLTCDIIARLQTLEGTFIWLPTSDFWQSFEDLAENSGIERHKIPELVAKAKEMGLGEANVLSVLTQVLSQFHFAHGVEQDLLSGARYLDLSFQLARLPLATLMKLWKQLLTFDPANASDSFARFHQLVKSAIQPLVCVDSVKNVCTKVYPNGLCPTHEKSSRHGAQ